MQRPRLPHNLVPSKKSQIPMSRPRLPFNLVSGKHSKLVKHNPAKVLEASSFSSNQQKK
jgi:hypothetical protein